MVKKRNDVGFSLIELVVVVAMLAVMISFLVPSIASIFSGEAKSCASKMDNLIAKTKVYAMSRAGNVYVRFYVGADNRIHGDYYEGDYSYVEDDGTTTDVPFTLINEEIVGRRVTVSYGGVPLPLGTATNEEGLWISFNRATGAVTVFGADRLVAADASQNWTIEINSGRKTITLNKLTGRSKIG
ncbi:prepilin-type N-terminal cleavage/methylation domain-containing protein [Lachnospiraceae bacterium ZAX-1]